MIRKYGTDFVEKMLKEFDDVGDLSGRVYRSIPLEDGAQKLPDGVNYKEYDINPYVKGQNRGAERIVIGDDGSVWYTNDHYYTFTRME